MIKQFAIALTTSSLLAAGTANAALSTVANYTFNDNQIPAGFAVVGSGAAPTYSGGQANFTGAAGIQIATPLTANDEFVIEAIATPTAIAGFDFIFSNTVAGVNDGFGAIVENGNFVGLNMGNAGFTADPAGDVTLNETRAVAFVRTGGTSFLYLDGSLVAQSNNNSVGTLALFNIGYNPSDGDASGFNGSIDQVRISTISGSFDSNDLLAVPEPSSLALLGLGGLLMARRRRN